MKTIVVGLGNPILGDDGVGWRVAEAVQQALPGETAQSGVEFAFLSLGGLSLMEHLVGYRRAILIDAMNLQLGPTGKVYCFPLEALPNPNTGHLSSAHDTSLQTALSVGRRMGAELPEEVVVIGIETPYVYDFSEQLSPAAAAAVPPAAQAVLTVLRTAGCPQPEPAV